MSSTTPKSDSNDLGKTNNQSLSDSAPSESTPQPNTPSTSEVPQPKHNPFIGPNGIDLGPGPVVFPSSSEGKPNPFDLPHGGPHGHGPVVNQPPRETPAHTPFDGPPGSLHGPGPVVNQPPREVPGYNSEDCTVGGRDPDQGSATADSQGKQN